MSMKMYVDVCGTQNSINISGKTVICCSVSFSVILCPFNTLQRMCTDEREGEKRSESQVKSSHLYLYSAFNNTNCNKALHNERH